MAENIDLARFNLDTSQLVKDAEEVRKRFEKLRKEQSDLRKEMRELQKEGKDSGKEFDSINRKLLDTESAVRSTSREYRSYQSILSNLGGEVKETVLTQSELDAVLNKEVNTIQQLRDQNTALNQIRNRTNLETEEGRRQLEQINARLDENNKVIKQNVDGYAQQKINIGNYREEVKGAINDLGGLGGALGNTTSAMGIATNMIRSGVASLTSLTKASLAFVATPIGAVITILAVAIGSVVTAFQSSEESVNKFSAALAPLKGLFNIISNAIGAFGDMIIDNIVKVLDDASKAFESLIGWVQKALKFLGLEEASESVKNYADNLRESANEARRLEEINQRITKESRKLKVETAEYNRELERLKVQRDDHQNSLEDRIDANNKINELIEDQLSRERNLMLLRIEANKIQIKEGDQSVEILNEQAELHAELTNLERRADSERRRMIRRQNSLTKSASDQASKARQERIRQMEEELELYNVQNEAREISFREQLQILEDTAKREEEILNERLKNGEISQTKYNAEIIKLHTQLNNDINELNENRHNEILDELQDEIDAYREKNAEILDSEKLLTDERLNLLKETNQQIFDEQQSALKKQLEENLITQKEFDERLSQYKLEQEQKDKAAEEQKRQQEKEEEIEKELIDFEERMERMRELGALQEEVELEILKNKNEAKREELDRQLEQGIISEELYNARLKQMNAELNRAEVQAERAKVEQKIAVREMELEAMNMLVGALNNLLGQQSSLAKSASGAMALINTYEGFTKALAQGGFAGIAQGAAILTAGLAQVQNILRTQLPFSGNVTTTAQNNFSEPTFTIPEMVDNSENASLQADLNQGLDLEEMEERITNAVEKGSREGSEQGLTNLSENRSIQRSSIY